jgi:hypothetical protein
MKDSDFKLALKYQLESHSQQVNNFFKNLEKAIKNDSNNNQEINNKIPDELRGLISKLKGDFIKFKQISNSFINAFDDSINYKEPIESSSEFLESFKQSADRLQEYRQKIIEKYVKGSSYSDIIKTPKSKKDLLRLIRKGADETQNIEQELINPEDYLKQLKEGLDKNKLIKEFFLQVNNELVKSYVFELEPLKKSAGENKFSNVLNVISEWESKKIDYLIAGQPKTTSFVSGKLSEFKTSLEEEINYLKEDKKKYEEQDNKNIGITKKLENFIKLSFTDKQKIPTEEMWLETVMNFEKISSKMAKENSINSSLVEENTDDFFIKLYKGLNDSRSRINDDEKLYIQNSLSYKVNKYEIYEIIKGAGGLERGFNKMLDSLYPFLKNDFIIFDNKQLK